MALVTTTLAAAVTVLDKEIRVASATSLAAGRLVRINGELLKVSGGYVSGTTVPVLRGQDGTMTLAHGITSNVVHGDAGDFGNAAGGVDDVVTYPARPGRIITGYGAAGAIALPPSGQDAIAIINGAVALAMTVAVPLASNDGDKLIVMGNGAAAHTVTFTGGLGGVGATADVVTFKADQKQAFEVIACGGAWCGLGAVAAGATIAGVGIA